MVGRASMEELLQGLLDRVDGAFAAGIATLDGLLVEGSGADGWTSRPPWPSTPPCCARPRPPTREA